MFIFRKSSKVYKAFEEIEDIKGQVQEIKADLFSFKSYIERDMEKIKHDFSSILQFLEEDAESGENKTLKSTDESHEQGESDVEKIKNDLTDLKQGMNNILEWIEVFKPEFKAVSNRIEEARKDIKNKISYAVSRLKT